MVSTTSTIDLLLPSQPVQGKRLYLSSAVIKSAKEREINLKENVSLKEYLRYIENNVFPVQIYLHNGNIKAYEVPLAAHSKTAGTIIVLFGRWNYRDFYYGTKHDLILDQNTERRPDVDITPKRRPRPPAAQAPNSNGAPYPTMVIEIGLSQSLPDLHRASILYFNARTTIQLVLAIKIFGVRAVTDPVTNITTNTIALIALLYNRTSNTPLIPTKVISFGSANPDTNTENYILNRMGVPAANFTGVGRSDRNNNPFPPCNGPIVPIYLLNIPGTILFDGVPPNLLPQNQGFNATGAPIMPLQGFAAGFNLDLWEIQLAIRDQLDI
ncbi:hypothetical protein C1645_872197 [Glomus cerebriforme]|uniref:Putative restriction endonuclease domain-containing protein n=1 Tax=Glomus cerebriforme TaxID=658196 RepID=A0A397TI95_9GLOM|nr:hypothetical protein C1645_872197 [Glomus cerebriforme]